MAKPRAGVIGLGNIGGGVARSLVRSGRPTTVFDVSAAALEGFKGKAEIAASPADLAASCDVVLVAVVSAEQVEQVLFGDGGITSSGKSRPAVCVQSTISVQRLLDFHERGAARGIAVLDSAVTGGSIGAEAGKLVSLVGASDADFERVRPVLEDFNSLVLHMGPPGSGIRAKVTRNILSYFQLAGAYEASRLAAAAGVDVERLVEAMRVSDQQTGGIGSNLLNMSNGTYHGDTPAARKRSRGTATLAHKDLSAAIELARELGLELPVAEHIESMADLIFGVENAPT
jgi:3-hydroxyisobutyrate dehydrogenase-like beta-hydroxyacid dehydrogenase